ncbi:class I SAM-dependent methyltransferase [Terricaulis sp.]|uniref:class I SAM-dependent methyltransferase n=1 Tax=Terricaulis sp. TaxID=2768686 RepID=UPI002AC4DE35|nr:class I SAM-dependent methyltransferase [Terricaulis sp.]MDZ4691922.1 class I SAM-dependent methyltransferase [Terricaulis sp.]
MFRAIFTQRKRLRRRNRNFILIAMDRETLTGLFQCPRSGEALQLTPDGHLIGGAGHTYSVREGVASFLHDLSEEQAAAKQFYDEFGWAPDAEGEFQETKAFVDTRRVSAAHARACMRRLGERYFSGGGKYILDAGCGPLVDEEVVAFGDRFERFICTDLSTRALNVAREKLGDRGIYLKCDITNMPIQDGVVDAITCNHVIYQLPLEMQAAAFRELWRVLKPGGVAVVVFWWNDAKLPWRLERLARMFTMRGPGPPEIHTPLPDLPHNTRSRSWFESKDWPFAYSYDIYNAVPQLFLRNYIPDDWRGRLFLSGLRALQAALPRYCGKHGLMPAIVFKKDSDGGGRVSVADKVLTSGALSFVEPLAGVAAAL